MEQAQKKLPIFILLFFFSFGNVLGIMYSAALPDLATFFQIGKGFAQQTVILFLVGYAIGQLIYGPLSSALGRKPAIYIGCVGAFLGTLLCILGIKLESFSLLLGGRFLTALGSSCGLCMTFMMMQDVFSPLEAKKKISILVGAFACFPAVGIYIGGVLTEHFSWEYCFYFMLLYSLAILILCSFLPETLKEKDIRHIHPIRILKTYFSQVNHYVFLFCSIILGIAGGIVYIFAIEAPYIAINQLQITPDLFGMLNLIPFFGLFLGGFFSSYISGKFSSRTLILMGALLFSLGSFLMLICFQFGFVNINTLFVLPMLIFFSFPVLFSSTSLLGISVSSNKSYASSLINCIQAVIAVSVMELITIFPSEKATALPIVYSIIGVVLLCLWGILKVLPIGEKKA